MLKKLVFLTKWMVTLGIILSLPISKADADPIDDNNVDLVDSVKPFTPDVTILGSAADNASTEFHIALKIRDLTGLQTRIDQGEQISLQELEERYYPTKENYQRIVQWLQNKGFSVKTAPHRLLIIAQGKASQVQNTIGVNLKRVMVEGNTYLATDKPPRIPRSIRNTVLGINGLQPYLQAHPSIESVQPLSLTTPFVPPYLINDLKTAYGVDKVALDGSGQRMGIVTVVFPNNDDLSTFWQNQNIPQSLSNIEKVCTGSSSACNSPPTDGEETLDTEMASGLAPAAKVRIYGTGSLKLLAFDTAYAQILVDILYHKVKLQQLSVSYGSCEQSLSRSQLATDSQFFAFLAAVGVTVLASSGDSGSSNNCPSISSSKVSYPASDVNVTSIGGTSLLQDNTGTVINETAWSGSGGGTSSYFDRPFWQVGLGVPTVSQRLVPDISLVADPKTGVYIYLNGIARKYGGTSAGAPLWNALTALINQNRYNLSLFPLGNLASRVYPLINTPNLRDITTGSNGEFQAGPGYDQVTGVGVPVFNQLVNTLSQY